MSWQSLIRIKLRPARIRRGRQADVQIYPDDGASSAAEDRAPDCILRGRLLKRHRRCRHDLAGGSQSPKHGTSPLVMGTINATSRREALIQANAFMTGHFAARSIP